jgi:hypothetical protein
MFKIGDFSRLSRTPLLLRYYDEIGLKPVRVDEFTGIAITLPTSCRGSATSSR